MIEKDKCILRDSTLEKQAGLLLWRPYPAVSGYHIWMHADARYAWVFSNIHGNAIVCQRGTRHVKSLF